MICWRNRSGRTTPAGRLHRLTNWVIALELLVLNRRHGFAGPVLSAWLNVWGSLLAIVIVLE